MASKGSRHSPSKNARNLRKTNHLLLSIAFSIMFSVPTSGTDEEEC